MKVVAFNGSPRERGNTYCALKIVTEKLELEGIKTEIIHVGNKTIQGCLGCRVCFKRKDNKCFKDDGVNEMVEKMIEADGIIIGSPVHFAGIGGTMKSFLDRAFYISTANGNLLRHKVGASVVAVRRSGGVTTFEQLNHFLNYSEMLIPTSNYWNVIHGGSPEEAYEDIEGVQAMKVLGENMAWLLKTVSKNIENSPKKMDKIYTNFIR